MIIRIYGFRLLSINSMGTLCKGIFLKPLCSIHESLLPGAKVFGGNKNRKLSGRLSTLPGEAWAGKRPYIFNFP